MKTKSHPSKARVSKIPPKSHSLLALAISELAKTNTTEPQPPDAESSSQSPKTTPTTIPQQYPENINLDPDALIVPETPPSPTHPDDVPVTSHQGDEKALICNGKDCVVSFDNDVVCFGGDGIFYCPSCKYKSAIDELQQVEKEFKLAAESVRLTRKSLYEFVGGGATQRPFVDSVEVGGDNRIAGNAGQGLDEGQERERNSVGKDHSAESDDAVGAQVHDGNGEGVCKQSSVNGGRGDENGNSVVDIGRKNDVSASGVCNGEPDVCKQNKSMADQQCSSVSEKSCDDSSDGDEDDLYSPGQHIGWRRPLRKTSASKMVQIRRENGRHKHSKAKIGIESNSSHPISTNENDPFRYQDESVVRISNTSPQHKSFHELRKRPRETSPCCDDANIAKKSSKLSIDLTMPESRRKRVLWTLEEEETLKEAVKVFSFKCRKNMSWKSVLEYGSHVFDGTRTPDDLRDKWRNMVGGRRTKQK